LPETSFQVANTQSIELSCASFVLDFRPAEFFNSICQFESFAQLGFRLDLPAGAGRKRHFTEFNSGGDREVCAPYRFAYN
jgi:hypothetical protein